MLVQLEMKGGSSRMFKVPVEEVQLADGGAHCQDDCQIQDVDD